MPKKLSRRLIVGEKLVKFLLQQKTASKAAEKCKIVFTQPAILVLRSLLKYAAILLVSYTEH